MSQKNAVYKTHSVQNMALLRRFRQVLALCAQETRDTSDARADLKLLRHHGAEGEGHLLTFRTSCGLVNNRFCCCWGSFELWPRLWELSAVLTAWADCLLTWGCGWGTGCGWFEGEGRIWLWIAFGWPCRSCGCNSGCCCCRCCERCWCCCRMRFICFWRTFGCRNCDDVFCWRGTADCCEILCCDGFCEGFSEFCADGLRGRGR